MNSVGEVYRICYKRFGFEPALRIAFVLLSLDETALDKYGRDWEASEHPRGGNGRFIEKSKRTEPDEFVKAINAAKESVNPRKAWRVDSTRSAEDYEKEGIDCYVCEGGSTFGLKQDGDIVSVCRNENGSMTGSEVLQEAIRRGGNHLDSYAGNYDFYVRNGFEVVSRCKFDKKYALPGWEEGRDDEEDIIFMKYVGKGNSVDALGNRGFERMQKRVPYSTDYQQAEKTLAEAMKGWKKPDENN